MSSTTSAAGAGTQASTASTRAHPSRPGAAREGAGDLFSSLLALLSAGHDAPALATEDSDDGSELPGQARPITDEAPGHDPLAALLGWPGAAAQPLAATPGGDSAPGHASPTAPKPSAATASAPIQAPAAALPSAAASGPPQPGLNLAGMTRLESPVSPDADTLTALGRTATGEARTSPNVLARDAAQPPAGSGIASGGAAARPNAWRSTVGAAASVAAQAPQNSSAAGNDKVHSAHQAQVAQVRSTVALGERQGQLQASETPPAPAMGIAPAGHAADAQAQGGGSGSPGPGADADTPDAAAERIESPGTETACQADSAREAEEITAAHWGTPHLRHASLRVGEAGETAIDIQLALAGQELHVDFRTDSADVRASLAQDARESLDDLLQHSGIQLGNMSVGAQSQQQGEHGRAPVPAAPSLGRGHPAAASGATIGAAPAPRLRGDGSRPLDLFV